MHGICVWLYGPERILVIFQLQHFWIGKFPTTSIGGDTVNFSSFLRGGDAIFRDKKTYL